jgi:hypothetical protein
MVTSRMCERAEGRRVKGRDGRRETGRGECEEGEGRGEVMRE